MGRARHRIVQLGIVAIVSFSIVAGCVQSSAVSCAGGERCPEGTVCAMVAPPQFSCVSPEQYEACAGMTDRSPCVLGSDASSRGGTCFGGACIAQVCGDRIVDLIELCDDGGQESGDGCSADCLSVEICGNGVVDVGEECDVGVPGLSADGCTSGCRVEYAIWSEVDPGQPPLRLGHQLVPDPLGGVLMFGGTINTDRTKFVAPVSTISAAFDDVWRWDGVSWSRVVPVHGLPPRAFAAAAYDVDRNRVVVFGGFTPTAVAGDTWEWDGLSWTRVATAGIGAPGPRVGAGLACGAGSCLMFGGLVAGAGSSEVWSWDGSAWTPLPLNGFVLPDARALPMFGYEPSRSRFVLHGGIQLNGGAPAFLNDTWELPVPAPIAPVRTYFGTEPAAPLADLTIGAHDDTSLFAAPLPDPGQVPTFTYAEYLPGDGGEWKSTMPPFPRIMGMPYPKAVIGAFDRTRDVMVVTDGAPPVMELDPQSATWSTRALVRFVPGYRPSAAYDATRALVIAVTDATDKGTWAWNGDTWRIIAGITAGPPPSATLAYDSACDRTVAFDGSSATTRTLSLGINAFTGSWASQATPVAMSRDYAAMAYDEERDVMVMFGGSTPGPMGSTLVDAHVWELRGASCTNKTWTEIVPPAQAPWPSKRDRVTLTYDPIRKVIVMFGGNDDLQRPLDETWEYDGTWTLRSPTVKPPPRADHGATYNPVRGRLVVFGGRTGQAMLNDTWEWDAADNTWRPILPVVSPLPRSGLAISPDRTGGLIAIGGTDINSTLVARTTRLSFDQVLAPREACREHVDDDGDGLAGCEDPDCRARCASRCPVGVPFSDCAPYPRCGDGTCSLAEDSYLCVDDCGAP